MPPRRRRDPFTAITHRRPTAPYADRSRQRRCPLAQPVASLYGCPGSRDRQLVPGRRHCRYPGARSSRARPSRSRTTPPQRALKRSANRPGHSRSRRSIQAPTPSPSPSRVSRQRSSAVEKVRDAAGSIVVWSLPQDIIDNTRRAWNTDPTSPTGYSADGVPTGRYIAPANQPGCVAVYQGDCSTPHNNTTFDPSGRIGQIVWRFELVRQRQSSVFSSPVVGLGRRSQSPVGNRFSGSDHRLPTVTYDCD